MFWIRLLSDVCLVNIFSWSVARLIILLILPFTEQRSFLFYFFMYLATSSLSSSLLTLSCSMWDPVPRWNRTQGPCVGSVESEPLDTREVPHIRSFLIQ